MNKLNVWIITVNAFLFYYFTFFIPKSTKSLCKSDFFQKQVALIPGYFACMAIAQGCDGPRSQGCPNLARVWTILVPFWGHRSALYRRRAVPFLREGTFAGEMLSHLLWMWRIMQNLEALCNLGPSILHLYLKRREKSKNKMRKKDNNLAI